MMHKTESMLSPNGFEQFEYRLLYLRPSLYSDECVAVGLVAGGPSRIDVRFISSRASIDLMTQIFGEDGVEQFQFAASEFRRLVARTKNLETIDSPTDLFTLGEKKSAFTSDRDGLLANVLESASCLVRSSTSRSKEVAARQTNEKFEAELINRVTLLNPIIANGLFSQSFSVPTGEIVELPILGNKIFGAPVSFAASDQKIKGESYIAKFNWLRKYMPQRQQPRVYLLVPREVSASRDVGVRELCAIAESVDVPVRVSESTSELAANIIRDEAA